MSYPSRIEDADLIDKDDQQNFLATADFLANHGLSKLISSMQTAATEVLKAKQLRGFFNTAILHQTIMQILDLFLSTGSPHHCVDCLMPEDPRLFKLARTSTSEAVTKQMLLSLHNLINSWLRHEKGTFTKAKILPMGLGLRFKIQIAEGAPISL